MPSSPVSERSSSCKATDRNCVASAVLGGLSPRDSVRGPCSQPGPISQWHSCPCMLSLRVSQTTMHQPEVDISPPVAVPYCLLSACIGTCQGKLHHNFWQLPFVCKTLEECLAFFLGGPGDIIHFRASLLFLIPVLCLNICLYV